MCMYRIIQANHNLSQLEVNGAAMAGYLIKCRKQGVYPVWKEWLFVYLFMNL